MRTLLEELDSDARWDTLAGLTAKKAAERIRRLEALLGMIADRALSPEKMPSTDHMVQRVPQGLIDQAREASRGV